MLNAVKQVRAAITMLNPEEVRKHAERELSIGLVASSSRGYAEMETFLVPEGLPEDVRASQLRSICRAGDPNAPDHVDLVIYEQGLPCPNGAFQFRRDEPESVLQEIVSQKHELAVALARRFPVFRRQVVERIVHTVSRENALFAIATALPNVVPSLIELPWAVGEFASDTAFLTANQIRMAFLIAAASGAEVGFSNQKAEILSIGAGAFGWRAIARELAGKLPLGGGLIPKGGIAYAGTFLVGKALEHYHHSNVAFTRAEREQIYQHAFERGKAVAQSLSKEVT